MKTTIEKPTKTTRFLALSLSLAALCANKAKNNHNLYRNPFYKISENDRNETDSIHTIHRFVTINFFSITIIIMLFVCWFFFSSFFFFVFNVSLCVLFTVQLLDLPQDLDKHNGRRESVKESNRLNGARFSSFQLESM